MAGMDNLGLRWRQIRFNPLRSLTPERLASALDQQAAGWLREAALLFEVIEQREPIIRSVMTKRRAAVARRDWQIITPDPDDPNAEAHKETLEYFYNNLTCTDATDLNVRTGVSGLLRQMMDSILQRYAVHEIVWKPGDKGLSAELRRVPLYFFENRSGKLRFIGPENRADGTDLDEDGWMITVADGLGEALAICYMYKRLGVQDWLAFSEKFSIPGVLGRTAAKKDSDEGIAMRDSVLAYASEWVGVMYGDDGQIKDPLQIIQTPSSGSLPQKEIAEYMDRMIATLVRGGDLSTISRAGDSSGSNPQQDDAGALLEDDCALVSETLQTQLDRLVIKMVHGDETPAAYIVINPPDTADNVKELAIDEGLARLGVKQDPEDLAERYGREAAEEEEKPETRGQKPEEEQGPRMITEEELRKLGEAENEATPMDALRAALSADLQPLGEALAGALQAGDQAAMNAALKKISARMPEFLDSPELEALLASEFTAALTDEDLAVAENRFVTLHRKDGTEYVAFIDSDEDRRHGDKGGKTSRKEDSKPPAKEDPAQSAQKEAPKPSAGVNLEKVGSMEELKSYLVAEHSALVQTERPSVHKLWGRNFKSEKAAMENAKAVAKELEEFKERFPKVKLPPLTVLARQQTAGAGAHSNRQGRSIISVSSARYTPAQKERIQAWSDANGGRRFTTAWATDTKDEVKGVFLHEIAHAIERPNENITRPWTAIFVRTPRSEIKSKISEYAGSVAHEAFAETFALMARPDYQPGTVPKEMETFMTKVMKGEIQ